MRPLVLRTESTPGALVLAGALILLGGIPRAAHAVPDPNDFPDPNNIIDPGIETCVLTATTSPAIVSLPTDRTFAVSTFTCTDKAPTSMFGIPCSGFEDADNTLGGTFDVHFAQSPTDPNEIDLTVDISNITMTPFTLCGFLIDVTSHVLNDQDLSYNPITGVLGGSTTSDVFVTVDNAFTATAAKLGTYTGSLDSSTGNLSFSYAGTWQITSPIPGLTPLATVILVVLLVGGAGFVLWRRRVAGA